MIKRTLLNVVLICFVAFLMGRPTIAIEPIPAAKLTPAAAQEAAVEAYIYGYPLVVLDINRKRSTNVATPAAKQAPMGQFVKMRAYPPADFRLIPAPNADTLYTMGWFDVAKEPWIFSVPDMGDRYYMVPMLDGWSEVFQVPGTRTLGGKAQKFAITGPSWSGTLPEGITEYKSPTALVWIVGRIYCTGTPEDYANVHALQDQFSAVPLSSYGKPYTPPPGEVDSSVDVITPVNAQVEAMSVTDYFTYLAKLMKTNPPTAADAPIVARMARIGLVPGQDFDPSIVRTFDSESMKAVPKLAMAKMFQRFKMEKSTNGWLYFHGVGNYGTDYLLRATANMLGPGWNPMKDAVYPSSERDANGDEYDGAKHNYVLHFDKGQLPPVNGFWSLTMYDDKYFFVPNPLNRFTLSQRDTLVTNKDGSVDMYLQADTPGKAKEANWLPAPKAKFVLMMRLYWPKETPPSILDGTWKVPPVKMVK